MALGQRVAFSTNTKRYLCPHQDGGAIGPTMSTPKVSKYDVLEWEGGAIVSFVVQIAGKPNM
jgi:hypothetical protein